MPRDLVSCSYQRLRRQRDSCTSISSFRFLSKSLLCNCHAHTSSAKLQPHLYPGSGWFYCFANFLLPFRSDWYQIILMIKSYHQDYIQIIRISNVLCNLTRPSLAFFSPLLSSFSRDVITLLILLFYFKSRCASTV